MLPVSEDWDMVRRIIPASDASFAACKGSSGRNFPSEMFTGILFLNPLEIVSKSLPRCLLVIYRPIMEFGKQLEEIIDPLMQINKSLIVERGYNHLPSVEGSFWLLDWVLSLAAISASSVEPTCGSTVGTSSAEANSLVLCLVILAGSSCPRSATAITLFDVLAKLFLTLGSKSCMASYMIQQITTE